MPLGSKTIRISSFFKHYVDSTLDVNAGISSSEKTFEGGHEGGEAKKAREPFSGKEGSAPSGLMTGVCFFHPEPT